MLRFGKKTITPDLASQAFLRACFEDGASVYPLWINDVVSAAELVGGKGEYFENRIGKAVEPEVSYIGAVMAICLPAARNILGHEVGQAIYVSLHRELSNLPSEKSWLCRYVFEMVLGEQSGDHYPGTVVLSHLVNRLGIEETPELMKTLDHSLFLTSALDKIIRTPVAYWWEDLSKNYVVEI